MTPTAGENQQQQESIPSSGLSAERVEEIALGSCPTCSGPAQFIAGENGETITRHVDLRTTVPAYVPAGKDAAWYREKLNAALHRNGEYARREKAERARAQHLQFELDDRDGEIQRLNAALASAREETAQAVRVEREACAKLCDDLIPSEIAGYEDEGASVVPPSDTLSFYLAKAIRSRSLPGETADA